jgi:hypothetical protein
MLVLSLYYAGLNRMAPSRSRDLPRERLFARLVPTLIEPRNCSTNSVRHLSEYSENRAERPRVRDIVITHGPGGSLQGISCPLGFKHLHPRARSDRRRQDPYDG